VPFCTVFGGSFFVRIFFTSVPFPPSHSFFSLRCCPRRLSGGFALSLLHPPPLRLLFFFCRVFPLVSSGSPPVGIGAPLCGPASPPSFLYFLPPLCVLPFPHPRLVYMGGLFGSFFLFGPEPPFSPLAGLKTPPFCPLVIPR